MSDPVIARADDLAQAAMDFPALFDVLIKSMGIQPALDPEAGFGTLQLPSLWFSTNLDMSQQTALLTLVEFNEYRLYIVMRAIHYRHFTMDTFNKHLNEEVDFDYPKIIEELKFFCPTFNVELALEKTKKG